MKSIHAKIGDHIFNIIYESGKLNSFFGNFQLVSNKDFDMQIIINYSYGVPFLNYEVEITKLENLITYRRADYLIEVDPEYKVATISVHDELALKHALMNLYSAFIVHHNWGLLIHSSCPIEKGNAHIFAGQSGAGKSTAARLSYPRRLLSDEATLVKIVEENITVFNSPFRSELPADNMFMNAPLSSVQLLIQAQQNNRIKVNKSDAFLHLMDKVFFWPHSQDETKKIMKLLTQLVKKVPVYELHFQKNNLFWELIS